MYDIPSHTVNKLSGELSSAFVNVAEANAAAQEIDNASLIDSGIMEKMPTNNDAAQRRNDSPDIADDLYDSYAEPSNMVEIFSKPPRNQDFINKVDISSGYSSISER